MTRRVPLTGGEMESLRRPRRRRAPTSSDWRSTWRRRWVLIHTVEELARHTGHADVVRELTDGSTGHLPDP